MMTRTMIPQAAQPDSDLVSASLSGNRDAFGHIVSRYQCLICSLAYSATGSLSQSEDLAQDTFVTAWKQLGDLREPEKLRAWLCGIARNLIHNSLRKHGREPSHHAESLESIFEGPSPEPLPIETAISKEESALLWRSLEKIPGIYREPLILFYREHQSIAIVAANLDLTEDAVKQRLSRGRKLLQEQFMTFVEGALAQTIPGQNFTLSVLSALPALTFSAKAAAMGGVAAKSGAVAKSAGLFGLLGALLTPGLAIFGNYASYRVSLNEAHSEMERTHIKRLFRNSLLVTLGLSAVLAIPISVGLKDRVDVSTLGSVLFSQTLVIYFLTLAAFMFGTLRQRRRYLRRILAEQYHGCYPAAAFEYRSGWSLFGLPLIHIRKGDRFDVMREPVKGWIAIGSSHALGGLFAFGAIAVAPISLGGIAIGLLPFGAIAIGGFSLGAISLGIWALGGAAIGWEVCCGCGVAWHAAIGGIVAARDYAYGGVAYALQTNTAAAKQFFAQNLFFRISRVLSTHNFWLMMVWIIPLALQSRLTARVHRRREPVNS